MDVTVETQDGLERRLVVRMPADNLNNQVEQKLRETARQVRLAGFRPGKVPMREVRRRFGAEVRAETAGKLVQDTLFEALQEKELVPAGQPRVELLSADDDAEFSYAATFEVFPDFELADLTGLEIERPQAEITEDDINRMAQELRERRKEYVPVERPAAIDDQVTIDFVGVIDGEAFEGGSAEDVPLVLGSNSMIPGFEQGLVGASAGDDVTLNLAFPDDYRSKDVAGKAVAFTVHVKEVSEPQLPALDEAYWAAYGVEDEAGFRRELVASMERELARVVRSRIKEQVAARLVELHGDFPLPSSAVHSEAHNMKHQFAARMGLQDPHQLPDGIFDEHSEEVVKEAERRVRTGLIFNEIRNAFEIEADPEKVREHIEEMAAGYETPQDMIDFIYANEQQLEQIQSTVLEEQLIDAVLERATVKDVPGSYATLVRGETADGEEGAYTS